MDDINTTLNDLLVNSVNKWVDLGCAPGGFSSWVAQNNPKARGKGFTLSVEDEGLPMLMIPDASQFTLVYKDITDTEGIKSMVKQDEEGGVDLVVAAAIYR